MKGKKNLPTGVYVNEEFPFHIKRARDKLCPVLKHIKTNAKYKDKCRIQGDKLMVDGMKYTMDNIGELLAEIAAYKAADRTSDMYLIFHGELSPCSNFHPGRFILSGLEFATAEHYIQYQKSLFFGDSVTANQILKSATALEAKKLSYKIKNFGKHQWILEGYSICERGVRAKFEQNKLLLDMLKTTSPRILAEASTDKVLGAGFPLRNKDVLNTPKWEGEGWLSCMLMGIREDHK